MKKSLALFLLLPLAAFASQPPAWVFSMVTTELATGATSQSEMLVMGNNLKMTVAGMERAEGEMSFRGDVGEIGEMIYNDDENRAFYRMNEETLAEIGSQMGNVQAQMEEALAGLPEAQRRAIMERAGSGGIPGMPAMTPPKMEMRATGERDTKAGYPCVKYEMVVNGRVTQHMWMTEWSNVEGASAARGAFEKFYGFMQALREALPTGGMFGGMDAMQGLDFRNQFAVVTVELSESGEPTSETVLDSVTQREASMSEFGPKEGYREQSFGPGR